MKIVCPNGDLFLTPRGSTYGYFVIIVDYSFFFRMSQAVDLQSNSQDHMG